MNDFHIVYVIQPSRLTGERRKKDPKKGRDQPPPPNISLDVGSKKNPVEMMIHEKNLYPCKGITKYLILDSVITHVFCLFYKSGGKKLQVPIFPEHKNHL